MSALFLEPHNDDAVLFACWTLIRERPEVITVLRSVRMGLRGYPAPRVDWNTRERESKAAMDILNLHWLQLPYPDDAPDWDLIEEHLVRIRDDADWPRVYAPAVEEGGNDHHNMIGEIADSVFGDKVTHYLTYTNGRDRSRGEEVPFELGWAAMKLHALSCFYSQIAHPSTSHHFTDHGLREWYA